MRERLISGDNHIDITYCPPELWSSQVPDEWKQLAPRVEEREDGLHWFIDNQDKGMWNGMGPVFIKYTRGRFVQTDVMSDAGFEWDHRPGARPRPTTPELRLADLDRDGIDAEIVYGCLSLGEMIADPALRAWCSRVYNDWAADFAKRSDPSRVFPIAIIPNTDPAEAAAELRRSAALGLRGGDLSFKGMAKPLYHHAWYPLWEAAAECQFPISFHSTGFKSLRWPDTPEMWQEYLTQAVLVGATLFQTDAMEILASLLASGACEKYPEFKFVLAESGVAWLPYILERIDHEYEDRARSLGFSLKPSDYFRRQGHATYQNERYLDPIIPIVGEDNILWGADYPHPDGLWPRSRSILEKNLEGLSEGVRRKITSENAARLYRI